MVTRHPSAVESSGRLTPPQREPWLDAALGAVADGVVATDAGDSVIYANASAETLTGWRAADALGRPLCQVVCLEQGAGGVAVVPLPDGMMQGWLIDRRGRRLEIEFRSVALQDAHGRSTGRVIVCRPRRQQAPVADSDALFEEKERAQVTLNSIGDAVISANFSGRVVYLNIVAEKMTGWTQTEAAGSATEDILRLIDADSYDASPCPSACAIIENRRVVQDALCVRRDGTRVAVEVSAAPIHDRDGGVIGAVMVAHDVTAARELSQRLERLALHDTLTDLPNRALFRERLTEAIANARRLGRHAALLYVDLDRFKYVNDTLGHAVGDKLLQTVARRLLGCVRHTDTVCRQGGDEFVLLLADLPHAADAAVCAGKILQSLESLYRIGEHELHVTASIGIAVCPDDAVEADALLRCADVAMYQAKKRGRNTFRAFTSGEALDPIV